MGQIPLLTKVFKSDRISKLGKFLKPANFLKKAAQDLVGINLGSYCLKGIIVQKGKPIDYFIAKNEDISTSLKKLFLEKKIPGKKVKISLKDPNCLVRYFSFPKMDKKRLNQALFYELDKFIPFSPNEVYFDFFVLKEINSKEILILLAVAKKNFIDSILGTVNKANLKISEINLDSICLINLFLNNYPAAKEKNSCLLDIGYNFSTMTILNRAIPFLTRDVKFSTNDIFQVAARIKNLSADEIAKQLVSSEDNNEFLELIQDNIFNLCKEMKNSFDYFEVNKGEHIDKLYLSGGLASIKGIENMFVEFLDTEAGILEVFPEQKEILGKSFLDKKFAPLKNSFSVAFGLIL